MSCQEGTEQDQEERDLEEAEAPDAALKEQGLGLQEAPG